MCQEQTLESKIIENDKNNKNSNNNNGRFIKTTVVLLEVATGLMFSLACLYFSNFLHYFMYFV